MVLSPVFAPLYGFKKKKKKSSLTSWRESTNWKGLFRLKIFLGEKEDGSLEENMFGTELRSFL